MTLRPAARCRLMQISQKGLGQWAQATVVRTFNYRKPQIFLNGGSPKRGSQILWPSSSIFRASKKNSPGARTVGKVSGPGLPTRPVSVGATLGVPIVERARRGHNGLKVPTRVVGLSKSAMHFVATGLPFSRATCNFIPLTRHARAAMAISTSEIRTDDVLSVPAPLPLCECESAKATLARAMSRAVAIANAGFVTVKSLHLRLVARMSAGLIHRRRCECRRDVMRGLQTIVTCVRMGRRSPHRTAAQERHRANPDEP
jgi:hypothetical protein